MSTTGWRAETVRRRRFALGDYLERESVLGYVLVAPAILILLAFVAYPFALGIWFSLTDKFVGQPPTFVGLKNYIKLANDSIFWRTIQNTLIYAGVTVVIKAILGMVMALLMNQQYPLKNMVRAALLLPWIVPTALSTLSWLWIFDPTYSVISWVVTQLGLGGRINWLGDPTLAMVAIIGVNIWRGMPFFAITLLAGLQMMSKEHHEAASIDGANAFQIFMRITLPLLRPVLLPVILLSLIWTISDFQLVHILTRGGPVNSTHLLGTLAHQVALGSARLGEGAAISLAMFPMLLLVIIIILKQNRRADA